MRCPRPDDRNSRGAAAGRGRLRDAGCRVHLVGKAVDVDTVREQLSLSLEYFPVRAIKTGMLYSKEIIAAVSREYGDKLILSAATVYVDIPNALIAALRESAA